MKKKKVGRPKLPKNQAREVFPIRLSTDEKKQIVHAANDAGQRPAEWARNQLLNSCKA